jgi:hypothetical protein
MSVRASGLKTSGPTAIATKIVKFEWVLEKKTRVQVRTYETGTFHGFDAELMVV